MKGKLNQLYEYLLNNHYTAEAKKLKDILEKDLSRTVNQSFMCNTLI